VEEVTTFDVVSQKETFWQKQFNRNVTMKQTLFDILFGIVVPIALLIFDPGVFRETIFASIRIFSYTAITLGITVFIIWLLIRHKSGPVNTFLIGAIYTSLLALMLSVLSLLVLAITLFPPSLESLGLALLGVLGLLPWLTAFVYFRNGRRALNMAGSATHQPTFVLTMAALLFVVGIPAAAQTGTTRFVDHSVELVLQGNPIEVQRGINNLKNAFWCTTECYREIARAYDMEETPERRLFLSKAYKEISGHPPEVDLANED
jgi:hypothetical protein